MTLQHLRQNSVVSAAKPLRLQIHKHSLIHADPLFKVLLDQCFPWRLRPIGDAFGKKRCNCVQLCFSTLLSRKGTFRPNPVAVMEKKEFYKKQNKKKLNNEAREVKAK